LAHSYHDQRTCNQKVKFLYINRVLQKVKHYNYSLSMRADIPIHFIPVCSFVALTGAVLVHPVIASCSLRPCAHRQAIKKSLLVKCNWDTCSL